MYIKPVNTKKDQNFYFLNPRIVFSALILGNWENQPLPSELKPPLMLAYTILYNPYYKAKLFQVATIYNNVHHV